MNTLHASHSTTVFTFQLPGSRVQAHSTLFDPNTYLKQLNKLLIMELSAIDLYRRCQHALPEQASFLEAHQQHAKMLVNLIIYNRGIPEKSGFLLSPELSILASRVTRHLGKGLARRTGLASCLFLETRLIRLYEEVMREAPYRDRVILRENEKRTRQLIARLSPSRSDDEG